VTYRDNSRRFLQRVAPFSKLVEGAAEAQSWCISRAVH